MAHPSSPKSGTDLNLSKSLPSALSKCTEAEQFAMELLMPRKEFLGWVLKLQKAGYDKWEWPETLGKLFGVPSDKAANRLRQLGI